MEFLQKRFFYQTNTQFSLVKKLKKNSPGDQTKNINSSNFRPLQNNNSGFVTVIFLPLLLVMITGIMGLFILSIGIKNITKTQSQCIKINFEGQKELSGLLKKILLLNKQVLFFHKTRLTLEVSIATAFGFGIFPALPILQKSLDLTKKLQKALIATQKTLLAKSVFIKIKTITKMKTHFNKLGILNIHNDTFYKKALALKKKKLGDQAYIYEPVEDFTIHQKNKFSWSMQVFSPLDKTLKYFLNISNKKFQFNCIASLVKKENSWLATLYH